MLIIKRTNGQGILYDTQNINTATPSTAEPSHEQWLHHHHRTTDLQFLSQYFPQGHPIFILFSKSFYYVAEQTAVAPSTNQINSSLNPSK